MKISTVRKIMASLALALAFLLSAAPAHTQAAAAPKAHRVVFVLTSGDQADWQMTLVNMRNLIKGYAPETIEIELIAYGPGLPFLHKASTVQPEIKALETSHVHFVACENSMKAQHVTAADLAPGVTTVPSGAIELITRQENGWPYIKAGR